ncbi:hypothetical protein X943_002319 [Babesia divergens]|uniref:Uncharacterized protein n=1 Tax=Babesia divergens TaxID=32595 RepID=A0AAD9GD71_BABDI|nr:hypothetical protein X943_002319 [Babesia divergens]
MGTRGHVQRDVDIFSKNGSQLAFLIRVASKKDAKDQHFWNSVLRHVPYVLYKANGRTLSHIANGLARAGVNDKGTWDSILHRYYQIRDDLVLLGNALSKVLNDSQPILRDIANRIRVRSMSNYRDHHLIDALLQQVISQSACMTMASIAILLDG